MSHETTTRYIENDHPTRSVCVPYLSLQHVTPRLGSISAFQSHYANTYYTLQRTCHWTLPHIAYRHKLSWSDISSTDIILHHTFATRFQLFHVYSCWQNMHGRLMTLFFFSFFFFSFGFIAGYLITVPTGKRPAEHTERLSLDNILLRCILKAQWQQKSCRSCTSCINNELSDPVITYSLF